MTVSAWAEPFHLPVRLDRNFGIMESTRSLKTKQKKKWGKKSDRGGEKSKRTVKVETAI